MTGQEYRNVYATKKAEAHPGRAGAGDHRSRDERGRAGDRSRRFGGRRRLNVSPATAKSASEATRRSPVAWSGYGRDRRHASRRFTRRSLPAGPPDATWPRRSGRRLAKDARGGTGRRRRGRPRRAAAGRRQRGIVTADTDDGRHVLRHSTAHVLAQAVTQLFPGAKYSIGPAIENGFYYDFDLPDGRTFTEDDLVAIEAGMREIVAADQPFVRSELPRRRGDGRSSPTSPTSARSSSGPRAPRPTPPTQGEVGAGGVGEPLPQLARVRRPLPRPARAVDRPARPLQAARRSPAPTGGATRSGRCCSASTARPGSPTARSKEHLHRLEEAEKRDHRKLAAELDLLSLPGGAGRRPRRVAPEGRHRAQAHGGLQPRPPRARRLRVRVHAPPDQGPAVRDVGPPRLVRRRHVPADGDGQRHVLPEADELPDALPHLPVAAAQLPRAAAAAVRAGHRLPLRAGRHAARPAAHPGLHAGRQPHLLHGRAGRRRDPQPAGASCCRCCGRSASTSSRPTSRRATPRSPSAPTRAGSTPRSRCGPPSSGGPGVQDARRATPRSTARRSTSTCATPSGASGSCPRSSRLQPSPSASSWSTSAPTTPGTARS